MDTSLSESELEALEYERADRSFFMQDVLLNTLMLTIEDEKDDDKQETRQTVRERASPMLPSQAAPQTVNQSSERAATASKNGQSEVTKRAPQRTSPTTQRTSQLTIAPQSRIEFTISRPHQPGNINVREVLVGNNNYASTDTARRKPICTVDSINQTTEPPTSH